MLRPLVRVLGLAVLIATVVAWLHHDPATTNPGSGHATRPAARAPAATPDDAAAAVPGPTPAAGGPGGPEPGPEIGADLWRRLAQGTREVAQGQYTMLRQLSELIRRKLEQLAPGR